MTFFQLHKKRVLGLISPVFFIIMATVMLGFITDNPEQADAMARGIAGPITWPRFMLYAVMFFAVVWLLLDLRLVLHEYKMHKHHPASPSSGNIVQRNAGVEDAKESNIKIWIGLVIIILYGFLIPILGFTIATLLYIVVWLLLGGIRKPVLIFLVTVLGTVAMLFIFVKLALMPLDRGQGVFGEITLAIYRFLQFF